MTGGARKGKFDFQIAPEAGVVDVMTDFEAGRDKIRAVSAEFDGLVAGSLAAAFVAGRVGSMPLTGSSVTRALGGSGVMLMARAAWTRCGF